MRSGKCLFVGLIILSIIFSRGTPIFRNRIFGLGDNSFSELCEPQNYEFFPSSSKHRISHYPGEDNGGEEEVAEIEDICLNIHNAFFRMKDGTVYGTGFGLYLGIDTLSENFEVPQKIDFPFAKEDDEEHNNNFISKSYCSEYFAIFCSTSFEECFGFGNNDETGCHFAGCTDEHDIVLAPISIFTGLLLPLFFNHSSSLQISNVFVGMKNTLILAQNQSSSSIHVFGTGLNEFGILSVGTSSVEGIGWIELNISSITSSTCSTISIKHVAILSHSALFIVTNENRWFFSGWNEYSTCNNYFTASFPQSNQTTLSTEIPQLHRNNYSCRCYGLSNELIGKDIVDLQCSEYHCVSLTNESLLYSWGFGLYYIYGRLLIYTTEVYAPQPVLMFSFSGLSPADDYRIERVSVTNVFTFVTIWLEEEQRLKVYGFGDDSYLEFHDDMRKYSLVEVFKEYTFTQNLLLSGGQFQFFAVFLMDTSLCWGLYANDSRSDCVHGVCYDFDECLCDVNAFEGDLCTIPICFGISSLDHNSTCNGKGTCVDANTCDCDFKQKGVSPNCTMPICYQKEADDPNVCSGNGYCYVSDICSCKEGFNGWNCQHSNVDKWFTILQVSTVFGVSFILFCLLISVIALAGLLCCAFCAFVFGAKYVKNRRKMRQFSGIKHLSYLLLEEQQQNTDSNHLIAHLRIKKELFQIEFDELELQGIIGEGGSNSVVYLVSWNGKEAAFKCFKTRSICNEQQNFDEFEKEVEILGSISHPNIIRYFGACLDPSRTGIVMEFCNNGDLSHYIRLKRKKKEEFEVEEKIRMLTEISSAMSFLHSKKIIHRDLKPQNVLLDSTFTCKLMDFGASKWTKGSEWAQQQQQQMTKRVGTSYFMSPEIVLTSEERYTDKVDVFSFGILMFVLMTEELNPYYFFPKQCLIEYKVANDPTFRPKFSEHDNCPEYIKKCCQNCWQHKAQNRPSFAEILNIFKNQKTININYNSNAYEEDGVVSAMKKKNRNKHLFSSDTFESKSENYMNKKILVSEKEFRFLKKESKEMKEKNEQQKKEIIQLKEQNEILTKKINELLKGKN